MLLLLLFYLHRFFQSTKNTHKTSMQIEFCVQCLLRKFKRSTDGFAAVIGTIHYGRALCLPLPLGSILSARIIRCGFAEWMGTCAYKYIAVCCGVHSSRIEADVFIFFFNISRTCPGWNRTRSSNWRSHWHAEGSRHGASRGCDAPAYRRRRRQVFIRMCFCACMCVLCVSVCVCVCVCVVYTQLALPLACWKTAPWS